MPNRLINETSPYLLQHAQNPVDWYAWGEEAFAKARAEDKPVLVSIGYAACHWCHVMEHESFEDPDIAAKMNERIVSIKVDREERPDVDAIYMEALQRLHGHGGWPLNMFLMPDGRPFYGGTYFPNVARVGMPSWPDVIDAVADAYQNRRENVLRNAESLTAAILASTQTAASDEPLSAAIAGDAFTQIVSSFDEEHGGFGGAPKFPQPMVLQFLLRFHARTGEPRARHVVEHTLRSMAEGGMYDHLGGGFARYATDAAWGVPHFEKMLYDNAQLASAYLHGYRLTGDEAFRTVVQETLDYLLRDLRHPLGGFFSSQDADSEGVEGKYYVWEQREIEAALGEADAAIFNRYYGVSGPGNFEGRNILHVADGPEAAGRSLGLAGDALLDRLRPMRARLLEERSARVPPATDDKVLTAWNGLALRALAEAASALGEPRYREAAELNAAFVLEALHPDGRLLRTWKDGTAHLNGYLEDYACLINGLLSLHEATFAHRWLWAAKELTDEMLRLFWDEAAGGLYDVGTDHETLIVRPRDMLDNAVPSGSSAAAEALARLATLAGDEEYARRSATLLRSVAGSLGTAPMAFGNWLTALERYLADPREVAIVGSPDDPATRRLLDELARAYAPSRSLIGLDPAEQRPFPSPLLKGRGQVDGKPTAYVCHGYVCDLPTTDAATLAGLLAGGVASA